LTTRMPGFAALPLGLLVLVVPYLLLVITRPREEPLFGTAGCLVFPICILLLLAMMVPSLGRARSGIPTVAPSGVTVESFQRVGGYDVTTLRAATPGALVDWLTAHQFATPGATDMRVLQKYIDNHWCFLAAALAAPSAGDQRPQPLLATFPAAAPVYPMALTATIGAPTFVDLVVAADQPASAAGFARTFTDQFTTGYGRWGRFMELHIDNSYAAPIFFAPNATIGSPDAGALLWDQCWVTRLQRTFPANAALADVAITLAPATPYQQHFYSVAARDEILEAIVAWGGIPVAIVAGIIFRRRRQPNRVELAILAAVVAGVAAVAGAAVLSLPTVAVDERAVWFGYEIRVFQHAASALQDAKGMAISADMTAAELANFPAVLQKAGVLDERDSQNPYTGKPMVMERSPGNFSIQQYGAARMLCFYDYEGREMPFAELPGPGTRPATRP